MARVLDLAAAVAWRQALRRDGRTLAVTNGCFDVLHAGHVQGLAAAGQEADALVVLLNSDRSVQALKGIDRPVYRQEHRAYMLASLRSVDAVVVFEGTDCAEEIAALRPDVYVKSDEYRCCQNPAERTALAACRTIVVWLRRVPGLSTSSVIGRCSAGRGDVSPQDPPSRGTPADAAEYSRGAGAPVADASTHDEANAGRGDAAAPFAVANQPAVSAAAGIHRGAGGSPCPRPSETSASTSGRIAAC